MVSQQLSITRILMKHVRGKKGNSERAWFPERAQPEKPKKEAEDRATATNRDSARIKKPRTCMSSRRHRARDLVSSPLLMRAAFPAHLSLQNRDCGFHTAPLALAVDNLRMRITVGGSARCQP